MSCKRANALSRSCKRKQLVSGCSCVQGETTPPVPCHFLSLSRRLVPFFVVFVLALTRSTARKRSKLTAKRLTTRCSGEASGAGCGAALKRSTDLVWPFLPLGKQTKSGGTRSGSSIRRPRQHQTAPGGLIKSRLAFWASPVGSGVRAGPREAPRAPGVCASHSPLSIQITSTPFRADPVSGGRISVTECVHKTVAGARGDSGPERGPLGGSAARSTPFALKSTLVNMH